jgi:hypothetical protein
MFKAAFGEQTVGRSFFGVLKFKSYVTSVEK